MVVIEKIYQTKLDKYLSYTKEENVLYVTDFVRCALKIQLEQQYKDLAIQDQVSPAIIFGELIHSGLEQFITASFNNAQTETNVEKEVIIDNKIIKIKGRIDAIIEVDNEKIVVEIKSSKSAKDIPRDYHKLQLQIYLWMTGLKKGLLVYITPERIAEFPLFNSLNDNDIIGMVKEILDAKNVPKYEWECRFCAFYDICQSPNKKTQSTINNSS